MVPSATADVRYVDKPGMRAPARPTPAYGSNTRLAIWTPRNAQTKTQACSGLSGDFDRVDWSLVAGHSFPCASGNCAGHWEPGHRIYLAEDFAMNEMVVRHEMLHDLLGRAGHPDPPFGNPCPLTWASWQGDRAPLDETLVQDLSAF